MCTDALSRPSSSRAGAWERTPAAHADSRRATHGDSMKNDSEKRTARLGAAVLTALLLALAGLAMAADEPPADPVYQDIDIDYLVAVARPEKAGTSAFFQPAPVRFGARVKQGPRKRKVEYLYTALSFFPLDPEPKVSHRMFLDTPGGHPLPVYVDDSQVKRLKRLAAGTPATFYGWHVYNYSKGPAILVTGFERVPETAAETPAKP